MANSRKRGNIPEAAGKQKTRKIPPDAGVNDLIEESALESRTVSIHFRHYKKSQCQINRLTQSEAKEAVDAFKRMGGVSASALNSALIRTDRIPNNSNYSTFYVGLGDVDLLEHNLSGRSRMFYFLDGNQCQVVAIRADHVKKRGR